MSTINRFLSRKDKHSLGTHKDKVMSSPAFTPSPTQTPSSTRSRTSSYSSLSPLSLAFSPLVTKRSPRLQAHDGLVECCTADSGGLLLQPKRHSGIINGFFEGETFKTPEKEEEKKVCLPRETLKSKLTGTDQSSLTTPREKWNHNFQRQRYCVCSHRRLCPRKFEQSVRIAHAAGRVRGRHHPELRS